MFGTFPRLLLPPCVKDAVDPSTQYWRRRLDSHHPPSPAFMQLLGMPYRYCTVSYNLMAMALGKGSTTCILYIVYIKYTVMTSVEGNPGMSLLLLAPISFWNCCYIGKYQTVKPRRVSCSSSQLWLSVRLS